MEIRRERNYRKDMPLKRCHLMEYSGLVHLAVTPHRRVENCKVHKQFAFDRE